MTLQTFIALALALLCVLYFLKDLLRSAVSGGCGSGCGSCKTGGCPVKKPGRGPAGLGQALD